VLDRSALIRHLAIGVSALAVYLFRSQLHIGNSVLWLLAASVLVNVGMAFLQERPRDLRLARGLSSLFGLIGWTLLSGLTSGVRSPFVMGLSLEILLSGFAFSVLHTTLVTVGGIAALWVLATSTEGPSNLAASFLTGMLVAAGIATMATALQWEAAQRRSRLRYLRLVRQLRQIEAEIEDTRHLGRIGGEVARVMHSLKNAVHSMRGFARMLESRLSGSEKDKRAMDGLQGAIDGLQDVAWSVLAPSAKAPSMPLIGEAGIRKLLEGVIEELEKLHPGVHWVQLASDEVAGMPLPRVRMHETLMLLAENAAEAMKGNGEVVFEARGEGSAIRIDVRDSGPGIAPEMRGRLFRAGATAKPSGTGFGLFLVRRMIEGIGGSVCAESHEGGGALFTLRVPAPPHATGRAS
jgi:signal transduction histidine kinase